MPRSMMSKATKGKEKTKTNIRCYNSSEFLLINQLGMKTTILTFSAASVLLISLIIIGTFKTGIVAALTATTTDATSTASDTTTAWTSPASASTTPATDASSTSVTPLAQAQAPGQTQAQAQPSSSKPTYKLVHVVGTKYIDYFTDGTKTYSFPGNPDIDSNLNKPNAPIPSHAGLTWVSTSGMDAYDTATGDLEVGDYAQETDGSYISNVPAYTYTDATSSVPIAAHIATSKTDPTAVTSQ
jgi:hypothetical protein